MKRKRSLVTNKVITLFHLSILAHRYRYDIGCPDVPIQLQTHFLQQIGQADWQSSMPLKLQISTHEQGPTVLVPIDSNPDIESS